jgi:hypothetical protein
MPKVYIKIDRCMGQVSHTSSLEGIFVKGRVNRLVGKTGKGQN